MDKSESAQFEFPANWASWKKASGIPPTSPSATFNYDLYVKQLAEAYKAKTGYYPVFSLSLNWRGKPEIIIVK